MNTIPELVNIITEVDCDYGILDVTHTTSGNESDTNVYNTITMYEWKYDMSDEECTIPKVLFIFEHMCRYQRRPFTSLDESIYYHDHGYKISYHHSDDLSINFDYRAMGEMILRKESVNTGDLDGLRGAIEYYTDLSYVRLITQFYEKCIGIKFEMDLDNEVLLDNLTVHNGKVQSPLPQMWYNGSREYAISDIEVIGSMMGCSSVEVGEDELDQENNDNKVLSMNVRFEGMGRHSWVGENINNGSRWSYFPNGISEMGETILTVIVRGPWCSGMSEGPMEM